MRLRSPVNELLPWQQPQWELLLRSRAAGRLPHALLCTGPTGLGKRVFAERFTQALLCANPSPAGAPCGLCRDCRLFAAGSHPDYAVVEPADEGKAIPVDAIRKLRDFLGHTSQFGGYKVALLIPAERMNINAANSLLKTLEEPPEHSLLLLVSAAPSKLPATVRSRCQLLGFHTPPLEEARAWVTSKIEDVDPQLLLSLASGAPLAALEYVAVEQLERRQQLFRTYCQVITGKADPVQAAQDWLRGDMAGNLRWLIEWHMDMIRLKLTETPPRLFNPDLQTALRRLAESLPLSFLFGRLDAAVKLYELRLTQVNVQLMIEAFLSDCSGE